MELLTVKRTTVYSAMKVEEDKIDDLKTWVKENDGVVEYFPEEAVGTVYSKVNLVDGDIAYIHANFGCGDYILCHDKTFEVVKEEFFKKNYAVQEQ